jgi:hypothetical protein
MAVDGDRAAGRGQSRHQVVQDRLPPGTLLGGQLLSPHATAVRMPPSRPQMRPIGVGRMRLRMDSWASAGGRLPFLVMPLLFSYGTLRDPAVQTATFGRELTGRDERIVGFRIEQLRITDPHVLTVSGRTHHPVLIATGNASDVVPGMVLDLTDDELQRADDYEVDDYQRVAAPLSSGDTAWVYVAAT